MRVSVFSPLWLAALAACASTCALTACSSSEGDESLGTGTSDEAELRGACALGTTCPEAIKVLTARTYASVPRNDVRDDVTVDWQGDSEFAVAQFASATSRKLTWSGSGRVVLTGNAAGTTPFTVDDFLLVEVLADSGAVLATGVVNPTAPVAVDGTAPKTLAPMPAWNGNAKGWSYDQVDITSLLPSNQSFRLRVGAYDVTAVALVSDVYLKTIAAAPPPPPPPQANDPFDASSCTGAAMTTAEAATRFANGTTETAPIGSYQLSVRERTCSTLTGCTSWSVTPNASSWKIARSSVASGQSTTASGLVKLHATGGAFRMTFVNTPTSSGLDYRIGLYVGSTSAQFWQDENARGYNVVLGDTRWRSYGAGVPAVMTNHCARMGWTGRQATRDGSVHRDLEAVLLARFDR